ncbi:hypothetical protein SAMN05216238_108194 [Lentibacillus persicus]|uniref:Cof subfamily of IIB subfamily of haloacid dehalogenase superfamily/HAD-superfamily hydrolase, subfamily IIB n=1 Tax=Lentibacillus persicus TaxID=640948 RepID=A0A1I1Y4A4_9BACI|nr:Cof-type HAD-IIB family hydrolase [Lentibacillus persicus]SFE12660.1 hypothetical protein SAMN05216238_108194 [Lentibacillus persicus]
MTQKLIFFDIDGTLLDDEKRLPDSTKEAIAQLQTDGHFVAIATGRAPFAFHPLAEELNIDTYVSINGQYVVHNKEAIYKNPLKPEAIAALEKYADEREHPLVHIDHQDWYANTEKNPYIKAALDSLKLGKEVKYNPTFYHDNEVYQTMLFCSGEGETEYDQTFDQLDFVRWHEYSVDVVPAGASKATGISQLIQKLDIPAQDIYAFGDGLNDIPMLKSIQNSVAMGNAADIVKKAAGSVTRHVGDDGIWHGLKQAGLLR